MIIKGGLDLNYATADSFDDHRMAMSLAILGAAANGAEIINAECVNISYPEFYATLDELNNRRTI